MNFIYDPREESLRCDDAWGSPFVMLEFISGRWGLTTDMYASLDCNAPNQESARIALEALTMTYAGLVAAGHLIPDFTKPCDEGLKEHAQ